MDWAIHMNRVIFVKDDSNLAKKFGIPTTELILFQNNEFNFFFLWWENINTFHLYKPQTNPFIYFIVLIKWSQPKIMLDYNILFNHVNNIT